VKPEVLGQAIAKYRLDLDVSDALCLPKGGRPPFNPPPRSQDRSAPRA
jgi:hypothetical protein